MREVEKTVTFNIIEEAQQGEMTRYIFKLQSDSTYTTVQVEVNGRSFSLDEIKAY